MAFVEERYQIKQRLDPDIDPEDTSTTFPALPTHIVTFSDKEEVLAPLFKLLSYNEVCAYSNYCNNLVLTYSFF